MASIPKDNFARFILCRVLGLHKFQERPDARCCRRCGRREVLVDSGGGHDGPLWIAVPPHQLEKPLGGA
jgi:hypothetical protein